VRRIDIDDEVYEALGRHAVGFQQPNDVLRALLGLDTAPAASATGAPAHTSPGRLAPLLAAGVINPGDKLVHVQPRKGRSFAGQVEADGRITTERGRYAEPSPALRELVGSQIDGWKHWTHEASGNNLRQLRSAAGGTSRGQHA
jgi:hypothetical protein